MTESVVEDLFLNNHAILEELCLTSRAKALKCFGTEKLFFPKLKKVYCFATRDPSAQDIANFFRCLNPDTIEELYLEIDRLVLDGDVIFNEEALHLLSKMTMLQKLSLLSQDHELNSKAVIPCLKGMKNLSHLGLNFTGISEQIPKTITSLDYLAETDDDGKFGLFEMTDVTKLKEIVLMLKADDTFDPNFFRNLENGLENCESLSVRASAQEMGDEAGDFFISLTGNQAAFNLRELNIIDIPKEEATILFQALHWKCQVNFNTRIIGRHFGITLCPSFVRPFWPLAAMKPASKNNAASLSSSDDGEDDFEDSSKLFWPSLLR